MLIDWRELREGPVLPASPAMRCAATCSRWASSCRAGSLFDELAVRGIKATLVGGAFEALELDAKRAIDQTSRLAAVL